MTDFDPAPAPETPLTIGLVLKRTWIAFRLNPMVYVGLTLLAVLPPAVLQHVLPNGGYGMMLLWLLVETVLGFIIDGAIVYAVVQSLRGVKVSIDAPFVFIRDHFTALLLTACLVSVNIIVGWLFFIIPGLIALCALAVAVPACMLERLDARASIKRSLELTRGYWLFLFVLFMLLMGASIALTALNFEYAAASVLVFPLYLTGVTLLSAFSSVMAVVLYFELRTIKDGPRDFSRDFDKLAQ